MRIKKAVETIKNKLKASFEGFKVDDYPEDFSKYVFTAPKGCLLVRYDASTFSDPNVIDKVVQDEKAEIVVFMGLRYKQYADCYDFLDDIKDVLTGLLIDDRKLYPKKRQYIKKIKGDFWWAYTFNLNTTSVQEQNLPNVVMLNKSAWAGSLSKGEGMAETLL